MSNPWKLQPYDSQVQLESNRQLGHELQEKYSGMTTPQAARAMVQDDGLYKPNIYVGLNGHVPGWVPKEKFDGTPQVYGVTYAKDSSYPKNAPDYTVVLDRNNIIQDNPNDPQPPALETLAHELHHVQDDQNYGGSGQEGDRAQGPYMEHFRGENTDNRLLPWEGSQALGLMNDRLYQQNLAPQNGTAPNGANPWAWSMWNNPPQ